MLIRSFFLLLALASTALCRGEDYYAPSCDAGCDGLELECGMGSCGLLHELKAFGSHPMWVEVDYLGWFIKGNQTPPLVTTSPAGVSQSQAGVLGQNSSVVFGGEEIDDEYRSGMRIRSGMWLDSCQDCGIEFSYLTLFDDSNQYSASTASPFGSGDGLPILARPFFNVETGVEDAELISYPNVVDGAITVHSSSKLDSTEFLYRANRYRGCNSRCDFLAGYRYFRFDENLTIAENLVVTESGGLIAQGTQIDVFDAFSTDNVFHGGQLGVSAEFWRDYVSLELIAKVALGGITRKTTINGGTRTTVPGGGTSESIGGLLALPTNIGNYRESSFAALPELGANLKLQLTCRTQLAVGYTLLLLNDVARTGGAIDRAVNPGFIPGGTQVSPIRRPAFQADESDFWVQGLNVGLVITK